MFTREECDYLLKVLDDDDGFSDWSPQIPVRESILRKLRAVIERAPAPKPQAAS